MMKQMLRYDAPTETNAGGAQSASPTTTQAGATTNPVVNTTATQTPPVTQTAPAGAEAGKATGSWSDAFKQQELKDYVTTKGFKDPEMLADSYKNLEKLMGAPKEKLLRLPDDPKDMGQVFEKLGKPAEAKGYKFEAVDGGMPKELVEQMKGIFHEANLTESQAEKVVAKWNEMNGKVSEQTQAEVKAKYEQGQNELKTTWGNAFEQNSNIAKIGAKEFGASKEVIDAMESKIGYKATMEFFHKIGSKLGEGQFTQGDSKSMGFGRMSPEAAKAQLAAFKADPQFMAKYSGKSAVEYKAFNDAMKDAYPGETSI